MLRMLARRAVGGSGLVVAGLLLSTPQAHAQAVVVDFESLACAGPGASTYPGPVIMNGFSFASNNASGFGNYCTGSPHFAGSTALVNNAFGGVTTLTKVGGGGFALYSIKLANLYANSPGQSITFTGWLANSTQIFQTFVLGANSGAPVLTQFQLGSGFQNVVAVSWAQGLGADVHQFDDVSLNLTAVPEPMTTGLLASGLVAMAGMQLRRRRRRA